MGKGEFVMIMNKKKCLLVLFLLEKSLILQVKIPFLAKSLVHCRIQISAS